MNNYTKLVGIVNITPDSFSDGFWPFEIERVIARVDCLVNDGASIIDIGAESSNPRSHEISFDEEYARLKMVLKSLFDTFPNVDFSLDTRNPKMADIFLNMGGMMINDYTGFADECMVRVVKSCQCLCVVNHFPGKTIQEVHTRPQIRSLEVVRSDLLQRKESLINCGLNEEQLILDPGIGFGKSHKLNWKLLRFKTAVPNERVYIGYSRKGFLGAGRFRAEVNKRAGLFALASKPEYIRLHEPRQLLQEVCYE